MKMLKNEHEVDASVTSRTPIPSPPSTKKAVAPRYAAHPPAPPVQVHPDHHAEDGAVAVAVAEHADGADARKKAIKTASFLPPSQNHVWPTQTQTDHDASSSIPRQTTTV